MIAAVIIQMHDPLPSEHNDLAVKRKDGACYGDPVGHGKSTFVGKVFVTPSPHRSGTPPLHPGYGFLWGSYFLPVYAGISRQPPCSENPSFAPLLCKPNYRTFVLFCIEVIFRKNQNPPAMPGCSSHSHR